jgi:hypothetical protein
VTSDRLFVTVQLPSTQVMANAAVASAPLLLTPPRLWVRPAMLSIRHELAHNRPFDRCAIHELRLCLLRRNPSLPVQLAIA